MRYPRLDDFKIKNRVSKNVLYTLYTAQDRKTGQGIFLKLFPKKGIHEKDRNGFVKFIKILSYLDNPNVCRIYDYGEAGNYFYIETKPVDGQPLIASKSANPSLSDAYYSTLVDIFLKIVLIVRQAHLRGVVHGFLHPDCIYVLSDGSIKIDDFGLHLLAASSVEDKNDKLGLFKHYVAPEIYSQTERLDGRADIYSLGVILVQFLTGHLPTGLEDALAIVKQQLLPPTVEDLLSKSIQKNRERRFNNCKDFVKGLKVLKRDLSGAIEEFDNIEAEFQALCSDSNNRNNFAEELQIKPSFGQRLLDIFTRRRTYRKTLT